MSIEPTTRGLSRDDLSILRGSLAPLRQWLMRAHGRRGLRDGVLGLAGAIRAPRSRAAVLRCRRSSASC